MVVSGGRRGLSQRTLSGLAKSFKPDRTPSQPATDPQEAVRLGASLGQHDDIDGAKEAYRQAATPVTPSTGLRRHATSGACTSGRAGADRRSRHTRQLSLPVTRTWLPGRCSISGTCTSTSDTRPTREPAIKAPLIRATPKPVRKPPGTWLTCPDRHPPDTPGLRSMASRVPRAGRQDPRRAASGRRRGHRPGGLTGATDRSQAPVWMS